LLVQNGQRGRITHAGTKFVERFSKNRIAGTASNSVIDEQI
jgi:hypothetical protein